MGRSDTAPAIPKGRVRVLVSDQHLHLTREDVDDLAIGRARMVDEYLGGPEIPHRLEADELREYRLAQRRGYLLMGSRALRNVYHAWCWVEGKPFAFLTANGPHTVVSIDTATGLRPLGETCRAIEALVRKHRPRREWEWEPFFTVPVFGTSAAAEAVLRAILATLEAGR